MGCQNPNNSFFGFGELMSWFPCMENWKRNNASQSTFQNISQRHVKKNKQTLKILSVLKNLLPNVAQIQNMMTPPPPRAGNQLNITLR